MKQLLISNVFIFYSFLLSFANLVSKLLVLINLDLPKAITKSDFILWAPHLNGLTKLKQVLIYSKIYSNKHEEAIIYDSSSSEKASSNKKPVDRLGFIPKSNCP